MILVLSLGFSEDTKELPSFLQFNIKTDREQKQLPTPILGTQTGFDTFLCLSAQCSFMIDLHPTLARSEERTICAHKTH